MTDGLMTGLASLHPREIERRMHGDEANTSSKLLFWLAIAIQIIDVFILQYNRTSLFTISIVMYLTLAILAAFTFHGSGGFVNLKNILIFLLISAFYVVVPFFLYLVPKMALFGGLTLYDWTSFFLAIFPMWPIYIGLKQRIPFVHKYVNFWIIFLLFLFVFSYSMQLRAGKLVSIGGRPELVQIGPVYNYIVDKTVEVSYNVWNAINPWTIGPKLINATGLNYYMGTIDNNEKEPVGVYIDRVRLADRISYVGYPVTIWADTSGKSFTQEIIAEPSCKIDKVKQGTVDPASFTMFGLEHRTFSCTFTGLKKGSYTAMLDLSFNFETWGYVTYTFVDQEISRAVESQGKNINSELGIPTLPRAIYTNGPVMLGMGSMIDQPVLVDRAKNTRDTILGVTLDSQSWSEGQIGKVEEFVLQVPQDFTLTKCDRGITNPQTLIFQSQDGYDFYRFRPEILGDARLSFQSLTCWLHIKNPDTFLGGAQKVDRTFVSQVKYTYQLEKRVGINVRE
jgi:hypothetical protein